MKKIIVLILTFGLYTGLLAENISYRDRLYYTCKAWGFVKYFHSEVSVCNVNWRQVLLNSLPEIKKAETVDEFNDALMAMLLEAGEMEKAESPLPDSLGPEIKKNLNFDWFNDRLIRSDVKSILDTIINNFRPHKGCWVSDDGSAGTGYLSLPFEYPVVNIDFSVDYPDESTRLLAIFSFWNVLKYFNPNSDILQTPWDSTLYNNIEAIAKAEDNSNFYRAFQRMTAALNDAHTQGFTSGAGQTSYYFPKLKMVYTTAGYTVVKSGYQELAPGDVITSVDGKTTKEWEDSLRPYISAGNDDVFRREMCRQIMLGNEEEPVEFEFIDSLVRKQVLSKWRYTPIYHTLFFDYYPNEGLKDVIWTKWDCNVGYVNMGNIWGSDVGPMYEDLKNTRAIIFDVRNYPNGTAYDIADMIVPQITPCVNFLVPDTDYPGTFNYSMVEAGSSLNKDYYKGKIIILCNQETQSHAEFSIMILQAFPNTVVVGSPTAGADGNVSYLKLSKDIRTGFSSLGVYYPDGRQTQGIGIVPDSVVYPTPKGIRQGRDEVLEKALEIAGCDLSSVNNEIFSSEEDFTVYPNPADDFVYAWGISGEAEIYNMYGGVIWKGLINNDDKISTKGFSPGRYFLRIRSGTSLLTGKFTVVR